MESLASRAWTPCATACDSCQCNLQSDSESRSRPAGTRIDDSRGQSYYSSPSKASTPESSSRRSSAGGDRPGSARGKLRRSPAPAQADAHAYIGESQRDCPQWLSAPLAGMTPGFYCRFEGCLFRPVLRPVANVCRKRAGQQGRHWPLEDSKGIGHPDKAAQQLSSRCAAKAARALAAASTFP